MEETKKCLWCQETKTSASFIKKAHSIPKSLGGQNYNQNVCHDCNAFFGNKQDEKYSIEEALKEAFNISRRLLIDSSKTKRQVGQFKSRFFDIRERNGKRVLYIKPSFRLNSEFQSVLCHSFKRGLYKMYFEELNRQKELGFERKYDVVRDFARYNLGDPPVVYFRRLYGIFIMTKTEGETPTLILDRMKYLYSNEKFVEIEFLGHVFGFPTTNANNKDFENYLTESKKLKIGHFKEMVIMKKLTDMDIAMKILNQ